MKIGLILICIGVVVGLETSEGRRILLLEALGRGWLGKSSSFKCKIQGEKGFRKLKVAAKRILPDGLPSRVEFDIQSQIDSENIPKMLDYIEIDEFHEAFLMEYFEGGTLYEYLASRSYPNVGEARMIAKILACTLDAIHEKGFIHRDLFPGNVLVAGWDIGRDELLAIPEVRLIDFGEARYETNLPRYRVGPLRYSRPTQYTEEIQTRTCDWFALGTTLYYMLTLEAPPYDFREPGALKAFQGLVRCKIRDPMAQEAILRLCSLEEKEMIDSLAKFESCRFFSQRF